MGDVDDKVGERPADRRQRGPSQQQLDRVGPPAYIRQGDHRHGYAERANKRHHPHIVGAKGNPHTQHDRYCRAEGSPG